jgi:peptidoglycan hydrolase CwlO-like protein
MAASTSLPPNDNTTTSSFTSDEIENLYSRLKERMSTTDDSQVTSDTLEDYYKQSDLAHLKHKLDANLGSLNRKVDSLHNGMIKQEQSINNLNQDIQKQNGIIKSMREDILSVISDFSAKLVELYQIQKTSSTQASAISLPQTWGIHYK